MDSNLALLMYEPFSKYTQIVLSKNEKYKKCDTAQQSFILGGMFALMVSMVNNPDDGKTFQDRQHSKVFSEKNST